LAAIRWLRALIAAEKIDGSQEFVTGPAVLTERKEQPLGLAEILCPRVFEKGATDLVRHHRFGNALILG